VQYENGLTQAEYDDPRFSYRVAFVRRTSDAKTAAGRVVEFVPADSAAGEAMNRVFLRETEKTKYRATTIVRQMKAEGFTRFSVPAHTDLWHARDGTTHGSMRFDGIVRRTRAGIDRRTRSRLNIPSRCSTIVKRRILAYTSRVQGSVDPTTPLSRNCPHTKNDPANTRRRCPDKSCRAGNPPRSARCRQDSLRVSARPVREALK